MAAGGWGVRDGLREARVTASPPAVSGARFEPPPEPWARAPDRPRGLCLHSSASGAAELGRAPGCTCARFRSRVPHSWLSKSATHSPLTVVTF